MSGSGIERVFQLINIAADTDLLIMFTYFWDSLMEQIIMRSEATKKHKAIERDIGEIAECIGNVRKYLTFVHLFSGFDTNSAGYGQGKLSILKLLEKSKAAREETDVFLQKNVSPEVVYGAGRKIFVMLYGGKNSDSLTYLRYIKWLHLQQM